MPAVEKGFNFNTGSYENPLEIQTFRAKFVMNQGPEMADFSVDNQRGNFNTGTGVVKGWRHQMDQGFVECVYGHLAIVRVEVQFC